MPTVDEYTCLLLSPSASNAAGESFISASAAETTGCASEDTADNDMTGSIIARSESTPTNVAGADLDLAMMGPAMSLPPVSARALPVVSSAEAEMNDLPAALVEVGEGITHVCSSTLGHVRLMLEGKVIILGRRGRRRWSLMATESS